MTAMCNHNVSLFKMCVSVTAKNNDNLKLTFSLDHRGNSLND